MFIESTSTVFGMPFKKKPRDGQRRVFNQVITNTKNRSLNVQLPTGYGKSFVSAGVYSILKKQGRVNRVLIIVPTRSQRDQFRHGGPADFGDACVSGPLSVTDISYFGFKESIRRHRKNENQIFICTSQYLSVPSNKKEIAEIMSTGEWLVVVDEYHHYGIDKIWGESVRNLPYSFMLAMSATPYRKDDDSAFGVPDVIVSYRDAAKEEAVKQLNGHSYIYRIEMVDGEGRVTHMTTNELVSAANSSKPSEIEKFVLKRDMRWSPSYISPLVSFPIERMLRERIKTGYKLQAIIGAMCVKHARTVCTQLKCLFPELNIDWVGTGTDGRNEDENDEIIAKFCPAKDNYGKRNPTLDVLVHVGIAGEGLDAVNVSEVVHLNKASLNNSNNQENGRAARYLEGVIGNISFDSCSEYSTLGYIGKKIMDAMDFQPPSDTEGEETQREYNDSLDGLLPVEPHIQLWNLELDHIDSGSEEVRRVAKAMSLSEIKNAEEFSEALDDPNHYIFEYLIKAVKKMRIVEAEQHNEQSIIEQWSEKLNAAIRLVTRRIVRMKNGEDTTDKSLAGEIKKNINFKKAKAVGNLEKNVESFKAHYGWIVELERQIVNQGLPMWLREIY